MVNGDVARKCARRHAERAKKVREPRFRNRDPRRHPPREPEQLQKIEPAVEARSDRDGVPVDDHGYRLSLLTEHQELRLVHARRRRGRRARWRDVDQGDTRGHLNVALRYLFGLDLDGEKLSGGGINGFVERRIDERGREMADDQPEETVIVRARAKGAIEALSRRARAAKPRIDRPRVVVGARVGLDSAADPLGGAHQAVEVGVADEVTISGHAPCSALVARTNLGSPA